MTFGGVTYYDPEERSHYPDRLFVSWERPLANVPGRDDGTYEPGPRARLVIEGEAEFLQRIGTVLKPVLDELRVELEPNREGETVSTSENRVFVNLDHYVGRHVEGVEQTEDGYVFQLEGGARVGAHGLTDVSGDPLKAKGKRILSVVLSHNETRMVLADARDQVTLSLIPQEYFIVDPGREISEAHYPQRAAETPVPPPMPEERVTE